jgi:sulfide:quinone oxidoreductase
MGKRVVVLGSNFASLTAAITLKEKLGKEIDVTVISASDKFIFMPSLIWVPFGLRETEDFTFPVGPVLEKAGVYAAGVAANVAPPGRHPWHAEFRRLATCPRRWPASSRTPAAHWRGDGCRPRG